jgi:hypothetical protein
LVDKLAAEATRFAKIPVPGLSILIGGSLETPLPDVPAVVIMAQVAPDVGRQDPVHPRLGACPSNDRLNGFCGST